MRTVRIIKDWDFPDLLHQSPGGRGIWNDFRFTCEPVNDCDYVLVINYVSKDTTLRCPPGHVWAIMQEPPAPVRRDMHRGSPAFDRVFTQDTSLKGPRYVHSQPALPWHVGKSYDELLAIGAPEKSKSLSWVTSNKTDLPGQRKRMAFREALSGRVELDLFGRGFTPIADKWDALVSHRYSLAIENFSNEYYWSEKLADCYLAWTMPIYYGCTRISEYFPPESMVQIDIGDADAVEKVREAVASDLWKRNRDAIAHARELVLKKHQLFPFMASQITAWEAAHPGTPAMEHRLLPADPTRGIRRENAVLRAARRIGRKLLGGGQ